MNTRHKSKTVACLLASCGGAFGLHRFYLHGKREVVAWLYLCASFVYLAIVIVHWMQDSLGANVAVLFPLSAFAALIESLYLGLTGDDEWDARYNVRALQRSRSGWPLVVLLVLTLGGGFVALIACMARATDLLYTGGSFG